MCMYILPISAGLSIYAYYKHVGCDPIKAKIITDPNEVMYLNTAFCKSKLEEQQFKSIGRHTNMKKCLFVFYISLYPLCYEAGATLYYGDA